MYFSSLAYGLLQMLRRLGLEGTKLAKAQCTTIRLKLLKIGALIRIRVRKVWVSLAGEYPYLALFRQVHRKLCAVPPRYGKHGDPAGLRNPFVALSLHRVKCAPKRCAEA